MSIVAGSAGTAQGSAVARIERRRAARSRRSLAVGFAVVLALAAALAASVVAAEFYPERLVEGLPRTGEYLYRILPTLRWPLLFAGVKAKGSLAYWFYRLPSWAAMLWETFQMAWLATVAGIAVAALGSLFSAQNLMPSGPVVFAMRRGFEILRTVPELVYALILVWAYGVGPLAGILALFLHTSGSLGKLFTEVNEAIDDRPLDGLRAAGASWTQTMRFGVLPQVLPNFLSYGLLRLEINVRGATVIGFVGAGGIGQELSQVISQNYYDEISAIVVLIVLAVMAIDLGSEAVRRRVIAPSGARL